jgi:iron complex transport system ATP-binding protein
MTASELSAGYNGIPVFQNFDLEVKSGKILTLIGANGSGKSTVLKTMTRLLKPLQGGVCLEGKSIHAMPTKLVAQKLALLPQGAQIPQGITVRDLAEYGRYPYHTKLSGLSAKDKEIIDWALRSTDMTELAEREMDQLSGGQRQRGWIAMALAQKTGILFLDEPTTYLDVSHQLEILQLLRRLNRESGVTVVMVLHDINYAVMFSDYIVAIKDGTKKYAGTPDEVVTPQMLHDIFNVDAAVIRHPVLDVPVCLPYGVCEQKITNQEVQQK